MFIAALFTIGKLWKLPRCPTTDEWIKKLWYFYPIKFYAATKKNEILFFSSKLMELENIILSEVRWVQKVKSTAFFPMWNMDLIQILQYYEKQVTLRGDHI
jgi:hypothetical protein